MRPPQVRSGNQTHLARLAKVLLGLQGPGRLVEALGQGLAPAAVGAGLLRRSGRRRRGWGALKEASARKLAAAGVAQPRRRVLRGQRGQVHARPGRRGRRPAPRRGRCRSASRTPSRPAAPCAPRSAGRPRPRPPSAAARRAGCRRRSGPSSSNRARSARGSSCTWNGASEANGHRATALGPDGHHPLAVAHLRLEQVGLEVAALGALAVGGEALALAGHPGGHEGQRVHVRPLRVGPEVHVGGLGVGAHAVAPAVQRRGQLVGVLLGQRRAGGRSPPARRRPGRRRTGRARRGRRPAGRAAAARRRPPSPWPGRRPRSAAPTAGPRAAQARRFSMVRCSMPSSTNTPEIGAVARPVVDPARRDLGVQLDPGGAVRGGDAVRLVQEQRRRRPGRARRG